MPAFGFYSRIFFCGLIAGLLSAIVFKVTGSHEVARSEGLIGIFSRDPATIGFLALVVGVDAALSFWALGPLFWRVRLRTMILARLGIAGATGLLFLGSMWVLARKFGVPLGLDLSGGVQVFSQVFVVAWFAAFAVNHLVRDETGKKLRGPR